MKLIEELYVILVELEIESNEELENLESINNKNHETTTIEQQQEEATSTTQQTTQTTTRTSIELKLLLLLTTTTTTTQTTRKTNGILDNYYSKWRQLAKTSQIDELNEYISEGDCFFAYKTPEIEEVATAAATSELHLLPITLSKENISQPAIICVTNMSEEMISVTTTENVTRQETTEKIIEPAAASTTATQTTTSYLGEPVEFMKCIEKLISSTQIVDKHLDNIQKPNKEFCEFEKQEIKLNAIKQTLESLAVALKTSLLHKQSIMERSDKEMSRRIGRLIGQLTRQHQQVVDKYREKKAVYLRNYDKWSVFGKDCETICKWLDVTLVNVDEIMQAEEEENVEKMKEIIKVDYAIQENK